MKLGIITPHLGFNSGPDALRDVAQAAESLGFASLWTSDHVIIPSDYDSAYPFSDDDKIALGGEQPYYELFSTMSFLAAVTDRVELGSATAIAPYRHPVLTAKIVSTLDQLSKGRVVLGLGTGWLKEEFDALGADFKRRGAQTDETIDFLRQAWKAEQPVSFKGEFVTVDDTWFVPGPYQQRELPLWIGGATRAALRRTAKYGTTWFPHLHGADPTWLQQCMEDIRTLRAEAGDARPAELALYLPVHLTDTNPDRDAGPVWKQKAVVGTPEFIAETLRMYKAAGVGHVALLFSGKTERRIEVMQTLQDEVVPAL